MIYTLTLNPALDRELTVSEIKFDQVLRASSIHLDYGGKGFNVSRALLAMGIKSTAIGFIGGTVGEQLIAGLSQMGIATDFVHVSGETRTNISIMNADYSHYIKVNEPGPLVSENDAVLMKEKISSLVRRDDWWVLAGNSPSGIKSNFVAEVVHIIQSTGSRILLDMEGDYLYQGCISQAFLVKPNQVEANALIKKPIQTIKEAIEALSVIHSLGVQQVVISLGKAGAVYFNGSRIWHAMPPRIQVRNPIGAGDAMLAGMLWAFYHDLDADEVLRWGVACGSASASLDGTAVGSLQMVKSLVAEVRVYEMETP